MVRIVRRIAFPAGLRAAGTHADRSCIGEARREFGGAEHRGGCPVTDRRAHRHGQRPGDPGGGEHFLDAHCVAVLRERVVLRVAVILGCDRGKVFGCGAISCHVHAALRGVGFHQHIGAFAFAAGRDRGEAAGGPGKVIARHLDIERLLEHRELPGAVFGVELLHAHRQDDVGNARANQVESKMESHRAAGAGSLDVESAHARDPQRAQRVFARDRHFARDKSLDDVGVNRCIEIAWVDAGIGQGLARRSLGEFAVGRLAVPPERRHAGAEERHATHQIARSRPSQYGLRSSARSTLPAVLRGRLAM